MTWLTPLRGLITRTATHSGSRSGEIVGDSMPGAIATAVVDEVGGEVVVDQDVAPGDHDAAQAPQQRLGAVDLVGRADQDGLGLEDDRAEDLEARLPEGRARLDDVGDGIRHAQAHGGLDGAVERHEIDGDAVLVEEPVDEARDTRSRRARPRDPSTSAKRPGGAAKRKVESAKPSASISRAPGIRASSSRSRPVMPTSSAPEPTYVAMSFGRR